MAEQAWGNAVRRKDVGGKGARGRSKGHLQC